MIAEHFFHEGNFRVGDCFLAESQVSDGKSVREPYVAMHRIVEQVILNLPIAYLRKAVGGVQKTHN